MDIYYILKTFVRELFTNHTYYFDSFYYDECINNKKYYDSLNNDNYEEDAKRFMKLFREVKKLVDSNKI